RTLEQEWPEARTFSAARGFVSRVLAAEEQRRARRRREQSDAEARRSEDATRAARHAALQAAWDELPEEERESIRCAVVAAQPPSVTKFPRTLERLCIEELARRRDGLPTPLQGA